MAVDPGISVSRVGGAAQVPIIKKLGGGVKTALAQYRELAAFAKFGSDLDKTTQQQLSRGERLYEILKQDQYVPMMVADQIAIIFAGVKGYLDDVPVEDIRKFESDFLEHLHVNNKDLLNKIDAEKKLNDETQKELIDAITDFVKGFIT